MARLIDADGFKKEAVFDRCSDSDLYDPYCVGYNDALDRVEEFLDFAPTVDAVPVVHGIWLVDDYDSGDPGYYSAFIEVHCSKCGYELGAESGQYGWYYGDPFPLNYCPNCGAKMDLEVE